jgi:hypothetical protein
MYNQIKISEQEENQISSQHDNIDRKLFNFLFRRIEVKEKEIGSRFEELEPIKVIEYTFKDLPGYGFNNFYSKKDMVNSILKMLLENDLVEDDIFDIKNEIDKNRQKIIQTIRKFLNFIIK